MILTDFQTPSHFVCIVTNLQTPLRLQFRNQTYEKLMTEEENLLK